MILYKLRNLMIDRLSLMLGAPRVIFKEESKVENKAYKELVDLIVQDYKEYKRLKVD